MVFSPTQVKFGYAKSESLPQYCRACLYLADCWRECPKNRLIRMPDREPGLNYLCAGLKSFFKHALPEVERIAADIRKSQQPSVARPEISVMPSARSALAPSRTS
jgi:uncharacterized protein